MMIGIGMPITQARIPFMARLQLLRMDNAPRVVPVPGRGDLAQPGLRSAPAYPSSVEDKGKDDPMRCPVDNETLVMADRNGVEIDYCPKCRGVWLDRGELDKIIEKAADAPAARPAPQAEPVTLRRPEPAREPRRENYRRDDDYRRPDDDDDYRYGKKKRREGFLSDLFDF